MQKTLKQSVKIEGIGLHSGCPVVMNILPGKVNEGISFKRVDMSEKPEVLARYDNVKDTQNCTCIASKEGAIVSTIEHIMAALSVSGINNAIIEINNQETPIMDGSGKIFYEKIKQAGIEEQTAEEKKLKVMKTISFSDNKGNTISLSPADAFIVDFEIEFPSKIVGHQRFVGEITPDIFESSIAPCRTFCEKYQVDYLQSIGLIKGGSLDNAIVLDGETLLNPEGFRVQNECVNHKVLDAIGDMYTSGYHILGRLQASKTGHYHNNELLKVLFSDPSNYKII